MSALNELRKATESLRRELLYLAKNNQPVYTRSFAIERVIMETFTNLGHGTVETQAAAASLINLLARYEPD